MEYLCNFQWNEAQSRQVGGMPDHKTNGDHTRAMALYTNVVVHDQITGTLATKKKEELQAEIKR